MFVPELYFAYQWRNHQDLTQDLPGLRQDLNRELSYDCHDLTYT